MTNEENSGHSKDSRNILSTKAKLRQYYAATSATIPSLCAGVAVTWTSPLASRLQGKEGSHEPLEQPLTESELSWVSSMMPLGAILGSLLVGFSLDNFGRKTTLLAIGGCPAAVGWIITIFADNAFTLYLARTLIGVSAGVSLLVGPAYISEFSSPCLRGSLCSMFQIMLNLGVMVPYCIGPYTSYFVLAGVSLVFPLVFLFTFFFLPETPYHLMAKNRSEEAAESLAWFRGHKDTADSAKELDEITAAVLESGGISVDGSFRELFSTRGNRRALLVITGIMFSYQFCGINAILFNAETVFRGSSKHNKPLLGPSESAIVTGAVQNLSSLFTIALVDKKGRRPLMLVSTGFASLALVALGIQSYFEENLPSVASSLTWLPVTSLVVYIAAFCMGLGPLAWIMLSELFTSGAKSAAALLEGSFTWLLAFAVTAAFLPMMTAMHPYSTYWMYSACGAFGFVITAIMLPETKCKTLEEIQKEL